MSFHNSYYSYFENLATQHKAINGFTRLDLNEYAEGLVSKVEFPLLILERPTFNVGGPDDGNVYDEVNCAFCILDKKSSRDLSFDGQNQLMDNMLAIARQILARMRYEAQHYSNDGTNNTVMQHFHVRDCDYLPFVTAQTIGYRVEFSFKNFQGYEADANAWNDTFIN